MNNTLFCNQLILLCLRDVDTRHSDMYVMQLVKLRTFWKLTSRMSTRPLNPNIYKNGRVEAIYVEVCAFIFK